MTTNVWKYIKVFSIFFLYIIFTSLIEYIIKLLGININDLSIRYSIIISVISSLLLMFILYIIYRKELNSSIKDYIKNFKEYFMFGSKIWIIGLLVMFISNAIICKYYKPISTNETVIHSMALSLPIYMTFSTLIFTPFVEEIIFRKLPRELFNNKIIYIITCGLVFGLIHSLAGLTSDNLFELIYIIPYGALGAAFAYMYAKKENIFIPITFHFLHNAIIVIYYLFELL